MSEEFMFDSDVDWNIRVFKMKEGFQYGVQVKDRDIINHKKLNKFSEDDYIVVLGEDNKVVYSDFLDEKLFSK